MYHVHYVLFIYFLYSFEHNVAMSCCNIKQEQVITIYRCDVHFPFHYLCMHTMSQCSFTHALDISFSCFL